MIFPTVFMTLAQYQQLPVYNNWLHVPRGTHRCVTSIDKECVADRIANGLEPTCWTFDWTTPIPQNRRWADGSPQHVLVTQTIVKIRDDRVLI